MFVPPSGRTDSFNLFGTDPLHMAVSAPDPDNRLIMLLVTGAWTFITTILLVSLHFEEFTILLYHVESESDGGENGEMDVDLEVHEAVAELSCQIYEYEPDPLSGVLPVMAAGTEPAHIVLSEEMLLFSILKYLVSMIGEAAFLQTLYGPE